VFFKITTLYCGTFVGDTPGSFVTDTPGTFVSDMTGTFGVILSGGLAPLTYPVYNKQLVYFFGKQATPYE